MPIHFGTDGWRAVISDTFTFDNLRILSQAIADAVASGSWSNGETPEDIDPHKMVVGFDTRFLSDRYATDVARVLAGKHAPRAPEAGEHLIEDQQHFVFVGERAQAFEHGSIVKFHAAGALQALLHGDLGEGIEQHAAEDPHQKEGGHRQRVHDWYVLEKIRIGEVQGDVDRQQQPEG